MRHGVAHVVAKLVLFLIAQNGKGSDGRDELIVAKSLETADGLGCRGEGEGQRKSQI